MVREYGTTIITVMKNKKTARALIFCLKYKSMSHSEFQSRIDACFQCATECSHCENACLSEQDVKSLTHCIRLNSECAAICVLTARMMSSGSEFANQISELCANVCDACARECENHSSMDHCRKCAEVCRACSEECRSMIKVSELEIP